MAGKDGLTETRFGSGGGISKFGNKRGICTGNLYWEVGEGKGTCQLLCSWRGLALSVLALWDALCDEALGVSTGCSPTFSPRPSLCALWALPEPNPLTFI